MRLLLFWSLCCAIPFLNRAVAEEVTCLPKIDASVIKLGNVPSTWEGSIRHYPLELTGINFSDGPPAEMGLLKPSYSYEDKKSSISKQRFYKYPNQKGAYWLICQYGEHVVFLSKVIPKEISECTVTYDKPKLGLSRYRFRSLHCK